MSSTELPASSARRPPRHVPPARSTRRMPRSPPCRKRPALPSPRCRLRFSAGSIFVDPNQVAQGHWKVDGVGGRERIDPETILETRDQHRKAKRIEPGIDEDRILGERGQLLLMPVGNLLNLGNHQN